MTESAAPLRAQVLLIDDEVEHAQTRADSLKRPGHICTIVHNVAQAENELRNGNFDVIVTDLVMDTPTSGLDVLKLAKTHQPAALQGGAYDFIEKPLDVIVFRNIVQRAAETVLLRHQNSNLRGQVDAAYGFEGIIGESAAIRQVIATIRQIAPSTIPVLITGESGTGKELVASAIHKHSKRKDRRFATFNAAGQSETLLEDQLFGHVRGAFTGADRDREGVFEYADKGTLFLDEIGDMPLSMQPKLLRVLETGELIRLGANDPRKADVRFISATNQDLKTRSNDGRFRQDLYFRLKGVEIHIPSLRERREDVPRLVTHAVGKWCAELGRPRLGVSQPAMMRLTAYDWPGNVRELINLMHRIVVTCNKTEIDLVDIPDDIRSNDNDGGGVGSFAGVGLDKLEKEAIRQTLALTQGNREQTAQMLGIGERTLYRKLKEYGLR
jgi:two-component system response regulator HydG